MIKNILFIIHFLTIISCAKAINLEKNIWQDFEGTIGSATIQMSIFINNDGEINGNYCYKKYEKKIFLSGSISDSSFHFTELIEDNPNGYLNGRIKSDGNIVFEGIWTNFDKSKTLNLKLNHYASCSGSIEHRYDNLLGTDLDVEDFIKHIKKSILTNDKEWVTSHVKYPICVNHNNKKLTILNKIQFLENYDTIFDEVFKKKIKLACSCNLFKNNQGVMLAQGEIWINTSSNNFKIIAVNN